MVNMEILTEEFETIEMARRALDAIAENESKKERVEKIFEEAINSGLLAQAFSDPYDPQIFETKVRNDFNYFNYFSDRIEDSSIAETLTKLIGECYKTVRQVYETINIKPELLNNKDLTNDISEEEKNKVVQETLEKFLTENYYSLTPEERINKYESAVISRSKEILESHDGVDANEATELALKSCVFESFLHKLAFPGLLERKIQYLIESESYGKVFDQERVQSLYETFCNQAKAISKVFAMFL